MPPTSSERAVNDISEYVGHSIFFLWIYHLDIINLEADISALSVTEFEVSIWIYPSGVFWDIQVCPIIGILLGPCEWLQFLIPPFCCKCNIIKTTYTYVLKQCGIKISAQKLCLQQILERDVKPYINHTYGTCVCDRILRWNRFKKIFVMQFYNKKFFQTPSLYSGNADLRK
jgi:hypothetical protein